MDELHPAGTYDVDTDEEVIEGNERTVYLRVATLLHLRNGGTTQTVTVDPKDLEHALARDGDGGDGKSTDRDPEAPAP
ncbi:hypothetical protein [Altericroceibacterium xinjiangense]|uniref:hypothetical protein n=1 Tax=Altericroceibacterium xinjiangense TaxID=762261 RepID=UPI000F7F296B|nr:hypothetical protein [Altericroceibacterium xinjiangense]